MTVAELIEELKDLPQDLEIVVEADHGQTPMKATWVGVSHVEDKEEYMMTGLHEEDLEEYPEADKIVIIQGY